MDKHFISEKLSLKMNCTTVYSLESDELELHMELNSSQGHLENYILPCALIFVPLTNMTIEPNTKYFVSLHVSDNIGNPCDLLINGDEQFSFEIPANKEILSRE